MSKRETILRYHLIINKLRKKDAPFREIAASLAFESEFEGYNFNVSKRTFQRDLDDIRAIYNIDILFDHSRQVYYIDYDQQPEFSKRIMEAFDTLNALNISNSFANCIQFEKQQPKGTENLNSLLRAIKNHFQIEFTHEKYGDTKANQRLIEPYILKEFKNRWYLVGLEVKSKQLKSFGLDRISAVQVLKKKFSIPEHINMDTYFKNCFGIISPNNKEPQDIVLSFTAHQGKYIKSLPLHETQQILLDTEEELQIKLKLYITYDFIMELLSHGERVKVLQPASLRNELKAVYKKALGQY